MERIYFDKQIFSHLFKGDNPTYDKLLTSLINNKDKFLYCYSYAHLLDLKNDKTKTKYIELKFIERIVRDNYISYHGTDKKTSCYLVTPSEAFQDIDKEEKPISFATMFDEIDLSLMTKEQQEQITSAKEIFTSQKIDFGFEQLRLLPDEIRIPLEKLLSVGLGQMTLLEWTENLMGILHRMDNDKSIYKGLRNVVDKQINNGKFIVDYDSIDFNEDLKNSTLQKSFIEYVNSNLNPNGDKEISTYEFYTNAYLTLDLLGISKEPASKVKFGSVLNDAYHSYYGAFCDYVVSDDIGFIKKTRVLYKLLGIETKVYNIDDFIKLFSIMTISFEKDSQVLFNLLINDLKNGLVLDNIKSFKNNRTTCIIKPFHKYLGYFNGIESFRENNQDFVVLRRKTKNYSNFSFFREYEGVINKAFRL